MVVVVLVVVVVVVVVVEEVLPKIPPLKFTHNSQDWKNKTKKAHTHLKLMHS